MGLLTLSFTVKWSAWVLSLGLSQCQIFRSLFFRWPDSPEKHLFVSCLEVQDRLPRFWKLSKEWRLGILAFSKDTLISSVFTMVALPSIVPSAPQSRGPLFYTLEGIKHSLPAAVACLGRGDDLEISCFLKETFYKLSSFLVLSLSHPYFQRSRYPKVLTVWRFLWYIQLLLCLFL